MRARDFFFRTSGSLRAPWQWLGFLAILIVAWLVLLQLAAVAARAAHWTLGATTTTYWSMLGALVVAHVVMLRFVDRRPWSAVGLARHQADWRRLLSGLAVGALGIGVPSGLLLVVHWLRAEPVAAPLTSWLHFAAAMAAFFLPQALAEEMLVRGYLFSSARAAIGWPGALGVTSVVFGALHGFNPGADAQSIVLVTLAGGFLAGVLLLTDSLYAAWMAHFAWNWCMAAVLHAAVSGLPFAAPGYRIVDSGPDWITGGAWGPEGGAGAALGMAAGVWVLARLWRRRITPVGEPRSMET